ncbi:MAG: tRNA (adenosine(37)-N6)-threonylcarbamoyltransferase complex transferase subunit TsaD [Erysipelotrichaceae bacterium]|nr:tRNA (adenosine(37)-N6)-threonylcarbamoyltransferase complex transferase subunit TsaD [Erysipelotrichaceae bacterium]MDD3923896.1 tRNA (adenosine(37)-N6)-threonylcarbamoyltransferase complex transferase subunit TsaD [Erysipelotrichaceae bacterium]MDD4642027.1 tRNA (adenosine(37)-N6)-threonylcarbamoyltransferase complex transferase subunit TsaD [Erysipelotrichaceae bacterium]
MIILAIESSCDETAVSILKDKTAILSAIVSSQIDTHAKFGGVVPEIASRMHIENIAIVLQEALTKADLDIENVDAFAVTQGPGLIGCLHVGVLAAKTLAWYYQKPLIPVHHLAGHIYANALIDELEYPLLALVVSGGHTELILLKQEYDFMIVGSTQDDAVGEAYDKVARVLGLPYPGGVAIDKLAQIGKRNYQLPTVKTQGELDFSFSGIKSAVLQLIAREKRANRELIIEDIAYAFQHNAVEQLIDRVKKAVDTYQPKHIVLAGGVAANSYLRKRMNEEYKNHEDLKLTIPSLAYCTDNATMIAVAGYIAYQHGHRADLSLPADSSLEICSM